MATRFKGPPQGWAALRWEVGVVFVGIVLALGAQQLADTLYWRGQSVQARHAIESELLQHEADSFERLIVQPCLTGQLRRLHSGLAGHRGNWAASPMMTRQDLIATATQQSLPSAYRAPGRLWPREAWERAQTTGALNHLPDSLVATYAEIYTRSQRARGKQDSEAAAAARLSPLAVDGVIEPSARVQMLEALALIDQDNATLVNVARQNLDMLRVALRDVPREVRLKALTDRLALQRTYRGACVRALPLKF
ncbi:hypothetical protein [Sphingomonas mesophila]|uniref:hypothetical protein n=1 Tax=Sphingomonas mesophila TaxID=2303576 RepID=UPI000E568D5D|nr:hypothetical protein [Sphingomonas mesophila]